mmetsp:Transcript_33305/g.38580  ORF Transcript_33305/g.38580 Transcript_33305/m.38580 type:complete len:83 (-) Transcript_33305:541-789(-)
MAISLVSIGIVGDSHHDIASVEQTSRHLSPPGSNNDWVCIYRHLVVVDHSPCCLGITATGHDTTCCNESLYIFPFRGDSGFV